MCLLVSLLFGCAAQGKTNAQNDVFTDAFFADVVEIRDSRYGQVQGEQMAPVISFLKTLRLSPADVPLQAVDDDGEVLYGLDCITFLKRDGSEQSFLHNHATLSSSEGNGYVVEGENLDDGLSEAFTACGQAESDLAALQAAYPEAFGLDTGSGLQIVVWKDGAGTPRYYLLPGSDETVPADCLTSAHALTAGEAAAIVQSYRLPSGSVRLRPFVNPTSSYAYTPDDAYSKEISALFQDAYPVDSAISIGS